MNLRVFDPPKPGSPRPPAPGGSGGKGTAMAEFLLYAADRSRDGGIVWWRPFERGYTSSVEDAGRYSAERAAALESVAHIGEETIAVPVEVAKLDQQTVRDFILGRMLGLRASAPLTK